MKFWNLKPEETDPADGVLDIDGEIVAEKGWFTPDGACVAKDFRAALKGLRNVTVHINSPGGDVMAGAEIYSALREHSLSGRGQVTVIVTALAASAASIIAMAGDRILMHPVAYMMIHNPWTVATGDAKTIRKTAKVLDEIAEGLISAYQIRTGKSRDELKRMLDAESWMSAATCLEEGFADEIVGVGTEAAASLCRPTLMSARAHGAEEILRRMRNADEEEEKPEETEEDPKDPEEEEKDPEETEEEPKDPEEEPEDPDDPEEDPEETEPDAAEDPEDPEEEPEETDDPEEEPEKVRHRAGEPDPAERARRKEIAQRAQVARRMEIVRQLRDARRAE